MVWGWREVRHELGPAGMWTGMCWAAEHLFGSTGPGTVPTAPGRQALCAYEEPGFGKVRGTKTLQVYMLFLRV